MMSFIAEGRAILDCKGLAEGDLSEFFCQTANDKAILRKIDERISVESL